MSKSVTINEPKTELPEMVRLFEQAFTAIWDMESLAQNIHGTTKQQEQAYDIMVTALYKGFILLVEDLNGPTDTNMTPSSAAG